MLIKIAGKEIHAVSSCTLYSCECYIWETLISKMTFNVWLDW